MTNNKKTLVTFLTEAKIRSPKNRESYWNDPDLFSNSDKWISKIQKGDIQLDTSPFISKK